METVVRVIVLYLVILLGLRILGKREFGQLSPLELVTLLLVPEVVSPALTRDDYSMTNAIVALTTLFALVLIVSLLSHVSRRVETTLDSTPALLVVRGRLQLETMNRERVSETEIFSEMHKAGLETLEQVRWAILETDGKIAIVPERDAAAPLRG